jgi:hypothetical protein
VNALASRLKSLDLGTMSELAFDRLPAAVPLDRETLLARFDRIRQFARGGRRAPHKSLLARLQARPPEAGPADRVTFNAAEAILRPLPTPGGSLWLSMRRDIGGCTLP